MTLNLGNFTNLKVLFLKLIFSTCSMRPMTLKYLWESITITYDQAEFFHRSNLLLRDGSLSFRVSAGIGLPSETKIEANHSLMDYKLLFEKPKFSVS